MTDYSDFRWIKVKHHRRDPEKTWKENYENLQEHHVSETQFLIAEVRKLAGEVEDLREIRSAKTPGMFVPPQRVDPPVNSEVTAGIGFAAGAVCLIAAIAGSWAFVLGSAAVMMISAYMFSRKQL
jgi:hypothetical protein